MSKRYIDVFNGDADGICALVQMHRAAPRDATLVTGVKRDIALLEKVSAGHGDQITVLDISLDKNRPALLRLLQQGASVFYADHHHAGEIPCHAALEAHIDTAADTCTSLIIHAYLNGRYPAWALTGAFGDNLHDAARRLGREAGCTEETLGKLEELGTCLNYNAYGSSEEDLHIRPRELFLQLRGYDDPLGFLHDNAALFGRLRDGYREDLERAAAVTPLRSTVHSAAYLLPDAAWARRASGVFGNLLARQHPQRAHAVLTSREKEEYVVSVRTPRATKGPAAQKLCAMFPTGGGRATAAGINRLPAARLEEFLEAFASYYEVAPESTTTAARAVSPARRSSSRPTK